MIVEEKVYIGETLGKFCWSLVFVKATKEILLLTICFTMKGFQIRLGILQ